MIIKNFSVFLFLFIAIQASSQESAVEYMSRLSNENQSIQNDTWSYVRVSAHGRNARKVEKRRRELIGTMKKANYNIRKVGTYNGDASLRGAIVKYLNLSQLVIQEDYGKIVDLEKIAEDSYDDMEAYLRAKKEAGIKLSIAFDELDSAQELFASKYNINLVSAEPDKKGKKLQKASEVINYYNEVYLAFFKSYKQEAYVMADFKEGDIGAFEQDKNTLNTFSKESLQRIEKIGSYNGDPMVKLAGLKLMKFYQEEASDQLTTFSEMMLVKEKFEKISKYIEERKPSQRTREDIDKYNATLKEYNDQISALNKVNDYLYKRRSALLDGWNDASEKFMSKQVPK